MGNVYCFGEGSAGQLGLGEEIKSVTNLTQIPFNDKRIVNIASNYSQCAAITGS